ncbi:hypothetical protein B0O99DRAFT_653445 [Bisporella sp. PMI_857]|nr:hypothetical protein B0O99DRAFT_653445 [Bisporella sp. PMI_857]
MLQTLLLIFIWACIVDANTEKVIFLGPRKLEVPLQSPTLEDLKLDTLSPAHWSIRTHIAAEFPTDSSKHGPSSWLLIHQLEEGRRYEIRICWAATQPTDFRLDTYELPIVFETPELITSLAQYADSRHFSSEERSSNSHNRISSMLFLRIQAAADYYTMNQTLMEQVPPVFVDIILDPFFLNVVPRSLIPTIIYIIILAIGSWLLSKRINTWLQVLTINTTEVVKKVS